MKLCKVCGRPMADFDKQCLYCKPKKPTVLAKKTTNSELRAMSGLIFTIILVFGTIAFGIYTVRENWDNIKYSMQSSSNSPPQSDYSKWIEKQFSPIDGSCYEFIDRVKAQLKDDRSFRHVSTTHTDYGEQSLLVTMTYRASNSFGATVIQTAIAVLDYKNKTIKIISYQ